MLPPKSASSQCAGSFGRAAREAAGGAQSKVMRHAGSAARVGAREALPRAQISAAFPPGQARISWRCRVTPRRLAYAARKVPTQGRCHGSRIACHALPPAPSTALACGDPVGSPDSGTSPPQPSRQSPATAARCYGALSAMAAAPPNLRRVSRGHLANEAASSRPCVRKGRLQPPASAPNAASLPRLPTCRAQALFPAGGQCLAPFPTSLTKGDSSRTSSVWPRWPGAGAPGRRRPATRGPSRARSAARQP